MKNFKSNGKLLITGEYVVLDGALSIAVPTKFGQSLSIEPIDNPKIFWKSLDEKGEVWFENEFFLNKTILTKNSANDVSKRLIQILNAVKTLNPSFLNHSEGYKVITKLDFPKNWGLGTSSTLINNIAKWANIDAYQLLDKTFGGSGYDIACAQNNSAITYQIKNNTPTINLIDFNPEFKGHLYFIHLNKKQNSREGIKHYHANKGNSKEIIKQINELTEKTIAAKSLAEFESLLQLHEVLIGKITNQTPVKHLLFKDFNGAIKSLGAWGGDFILATSTTDPTTYFKTKGFNTVIPYCDMVL
ncbi:GYDIA family GHMP kinase [Flavisericum labens]|uniref:GYDIA family GHMP kinase n=1 Tax=Flavisericum labens TaxID=3377112 RepID=UPI00387B01AC